MEWTPPTLAPYETETGEEMNVRHKRTKSLSLLRQSSPEFDRYGGCGGSQHWAPKLPAFGHEARNLPEAFLSPP